MHPESSFEMSKLAPAHQSLSLAGEFLLLNSLLNFLTTYVQSLERSVEGSTEQGQVKTGQSCFLRYSLPDYLYCLLSGCLAYLQCLIGHQGPSWATAIMSPQCLCKLAWPSGNLNLTL